MVVAVLARGSQGDRLGSWNLTWGFGIIRVTSERLDFSLPIPTWILQVKKVRLAQTAESPKRRPALIPGYETADAPSCP